jgi:hypothetical protein
MCPDHGAWAWCGQHAGPGLGCPHCEKATRGEQPKVAITIFINAVRAGHGHRLEADGFVHAPEELRGMFPEKVEDHSLAELIRQVQDKVIELGVGNETKPIWDRAIVRWHTTDFGRFNRMGVLVSNLQNGSHVQVGQWIAEAGVRAKIPTDVTGKGSAIVAAVVPLPTDQPLTRTSEIMKIVGTVIGLAAGHALFTIASFKSLLHEQLVHFLARTISESLRQRVKVSKVKQRKKVKQRQKLRLRL